MLRLFPIVVLLSALLSALLFACSFDYNASSGAEDERPDIIMENLAYVRVRGGDPQVRFQAEHAERWEDRQLMAIKTFMFEQMEDKGDTVNVAGSAGAAKVQLDSGNVSFSEGVEISVESEDIVIRTEGLEWQDREKLLSAGQEDEVVIERSDGTGFTGRGFSADARNWTWSFSGGVQGTFVEEDEDAGGE